MADRNLADILEEITVCEQAIVLGNDLDGSRYRRLGVLRHEIEEHPAAAAGKDLPPVIGVLGS